MEKNKHKEHKPLQTQDFESLNNLAYTTIVKLETPLGINASGRDDRYAAFFGRDSMITCLKLLKVHKKKPDDVFLRIIKHTIQTAVRLQGKKINLKSGEKPGKIIHEYREKGYYHLMKHPFHWYIYPDKTLRNYDSVDATPLFLILAAEYINTTNDVKLLESLIPTVETAFNYLKEFSPKGGSRIFLEYQLHRPIPHGGLVNQGWMDSVDSLLIYGKPPKEPVALVEVQGYYFKANLKRNMIDNHVQLIEEFQEKKNIADPILKFFGFYVVGSLLSSHGLDKKHITDKDLTQSEFNELRQEWLKPVLDLQRGNPMSEFFDKVFDTRKGELVEIITALTKSYKKNMTLLNLCFDNSVVNNPKIKKLSDETFDKSVIDNLELLRK